jgi:hypothetical protein
MTNNFLCFLFFFIVISSRSQERKKIGLKPSKIGFLYNLGSSENFIFDDIDYTYATNTYKVQAFYKLGNWKNVEIDLIVQPQVQFLKHQLINEQFITPDQTNYLEKRVEFGFAAKKQLSEKLDLQGIASLGFSSIDTRTERLAKGFTFIENFSLGVSYQAFKNYFIYIGSNFGHVSNLNFQKPNDGYNILGLEVGYSYLLQ